MKLTDKIKPKIGHFVLNRTLKKIIRIRKINNFDSAKTLGIVFNATHQNNYEKIKNFISFLSDYDLKVLAIGFVNDNKIPDNYLYYTGFNFFSKKNLNWYFKPRDPDVDKFIDKQFDILIDFSLGDYFPVQYIVGLSKAKFKVGRLSEKNNYYDLMIALEKYKKPEVLTDIEKSKKLYLNIDVEKENKLDFFIEQVKHYLSIINKKTLIN